MLGFLLRSPPGLLGVGVSVCGGGVVVWCCGSVVVLIVGVVVVMAGRKWKWMLMGGRGSVQVVCP